jgi:N-acetylglucosamine-6-phosphate deacetylase
MSNLYPWPEPPSSEQLVIRLAPDSGAYDGGASIGGALSPGVRVLEWKGEQFVGARLAEAREQRLLPADPGVFCTPGLFDVQINGYWGRGFKDVDRGPEGVRDLCWSIALSGSTRFLPTVTTDDPDTMRAAMANIHEACRRYPDVAAMVAGIHQEGPWISPTDGPRGAHPLAHVAAPDLAEFERLQRAAGGRIVMLTVAPEVEGAIEFIRQVARQGVVVCLGHHEAGAEVIRQAVEAGAQSVTHLGNGCHTTMARHPNLIWEQAAEDRLYAGIITDGHHLPPATARVLYRATPRDRLIVVSDAISMAGAPPGLYRMRDAIAELTAAGRFGFYRSPILIGAAVPLARCWANLTRFMGGGSPVDYLPHVTRVPAALMGGAPAGGSEITEQVGQPGTPATFCLWKWDPETPDLVPQRIVIRGRTIYDRQTRPTAIPFGRLPPRAD